MRRHLDGCQRCERASQAVACTMYLIAVLISRTMPWTAAFDLQRNVMDWVASHAVG